jgi:sugar phosphate isomerase/epimerase
VKFTDTLGFARYVRELGAEGVQTPLRSRDSAVASQIRAFGEETNSYYEGELRLPKTDADLSDFETDVRLAREAGASVARAVFTNGRRYEAFKTLADFRAFEAQVEKTLVLIEPVLRKHQLKVAIENHKDHTADELAKLMKIISSEWIGVLVDTGNNLALLEDPYATMDALAPFALSVHLKDMAVQACDDGFLLSEVPLGTGMLDLPRIITTLRMANPALAFNLEMATRDPLKVPCLTDGYWTTFPERKSTHRDAALARVEANPPRQPVPGIAGKPVAAVLVEEGSNNRHGLAWMQKHFRA